MMQFFPIGVTDFDAFHKLADAYYREGEDAQTPQEEIDSFIKELAPIVQRLRDMSPLYEGAEK